MKIRNFLYRKMFFAIIIAVAMTISFSAYSQNNSGKSQLSGAVRLEYKYQIQVPLKYLTLSKMTQVMDIQGQSMQNNISSVIGCTIKSAGKRGPDLILEIKIDSLGQTVESPMGTSGGPVNEVKGKLFNLYISPDGKDIDVTEAEKVVYNLEGSGESNMSQAFLDFFPQLPGTAVKPGDTWNTVDTVKGKNASTLTVNELNSTDKLEGFENISGMDCARISSALSGTMTINTQNQGMDIRMKGTYTGTASYLFAVKEGYFVSQSVSTKITGNIEISSPESMTFPMVMDVTSSTEIKK